MDDHGIGCRLGHGGNGTIRTKYSSLPPLRWRPPVEEEFTPSLMVKDKLNECGAWRRGGATEPDSPHRRKWS